MEQNEVSPPECKSVGFLSEKDLANLREALTVTREAVTAGEGPFGAVIAGPDGEILMRQTNATVQLRDHTRHAETYLASQFCNRYYDSPEFRRGSTLYSSMEPCAMCMFTLFAAGIGRVLYGLSADRLYDLCNQAGVWPRTHISAHECTQLMSIPMVVEGPFLEEEAASIVQELLDAYRAGKAGRPGLRGR